MDDIKKFSDYLLLSDSEDDYSDRTRELVGEISTSFDYTVTVLSNKAQIIEHFQTPPPEMFTKSINVDCCNLVPVYAVNNKNSASYMSDLANYVKREELAKKLFGSFLDVCKIMESFGYYDYLNLSLEGKRGRTVLFSVSEHETDKRKLQQRVHKNMDLIKSLGSAIANTIDPAGRCLQEKITPQQIEVLQALISGRGTKNDAAQTLGITIRAIDNHIKNIKGRTGITSLNLILAEALREKVIT